MRIKLITHCSLVFLYTLVCKLNMLSAGQFFEGIRCKISKLCNTALFWFFVINDSTDLWYFPAAD